MSSTTQNWAEKFRHHIPGTSITCSSFDPSEDLLWNGSSTGQVTSLLYPRKGAPFFKYTSFPGHNPAPVAQILPLEHGIYSIGFQNCKCTTRQGVVVWNKLIKNGTSITTTGMQSELLVASSDGMFSLVNMNRGVVLKQMECDEGVTEMKHGKYVVSASTNGNITFWDPSSYKKEHCTKFHTGGVSNFDIAGNYLVTTGYSLRGSTTLVPDPMVKVFDLRTNKFLAPIPFSAGPSFVRFHPNYASLILASSRTGSLQITDINDSNQFRSQFMQASISGYLNSMEFSSSGEMIAIGDAFGTVQVWTQHSRPNPKINIHSRQPIYRDFQAENLPRMNEESPLSTIGMPYYSQPLLSQWPNNFNYRIGKNPNKIPPEVLKNVKMVDFVGYSPNPRTFRRNQAFTQEFEEGPKKPKFRSEQELEQMKTGTKRKDEEHENNISIADGIPFHYRSVEIKYSRFGVEDFDFGFYNKTEYAGLESDIQNSYCNSLLQMLFFIRPLRELAKNHIRSSCFKEPCLTCELGFLFRMLEGANGVNCQASNFLRAFGLIRQANALGLLEPEHITAESQIAYGSLIQTFFRFLLEQIYQEAAGPSISIESDKLLPRLFRIPLLSISCCNSNSSHQHEREISPFIIDLSYPRNSPGLTFSEVLLQSINRETTTKAWCANCNLYQMTTQKKKLTKMPNFMCINANVINENDLQYWVGEGCSKQNWLPSTLVLVIRYNELSVIDLDRTPFNPLSYGPDAEIAIFDLRATIAEIKIGKGPIHLVSHINVSETEQPNWYFFNDFSVLSLENEERVFQKWKIPSIIQYARRSPETTSSFFLSPVNPDFRILLDNHLLNQRSDLVLRYMPLAPEEIPRQPGYLCAIDAEFVIMSTAESEIRSDGTNTIIRPPRYSLARVSVVRGESFKEGIPFIDDYICTTEPVYDYLTEYSGIQDGDLDPAQSRHPLVSLKVAYKRLRLLVDMGCIFVGHDLRKDCRTINIHIPPSQIVDTVTIFRFKNRQRKLSLRFLAWCLLKEDIQTVTHDSVEDARTALALYKKYLEIKAAGNFEKVMEELYAEGKKLNFRPPNQKSTIMLALQDHFKLLNSLKSLQQDSNSDTQVMVPQGRFALFKGKIKKPTKVFMDNGKGNMKEIPLETAISIVELKIAGGFHFEKPLIRLIELQKELKEELNRQLTSDTAEVNEDGNEFVEISSHGDDLFHDSLETVKICIPSNKSYVKDMKPQGSQETIDQEDLAFLDRIRAMELEENMGTKPEQDVTESELNLDKPNQRDENDTLLDIKTQQDPTINHINRPLASVVENDFSSSTSEESEDELDLQMLGKEISMEYYRKKAQFIASKIVQEHKEYE